MPRRRLLALLPVAALLVGGDCTEDPHLFVTSPLNGAFVTAPSITVAGTLARAGRSGNLTVNGSPVPLQPGGDFSIPLAVSADEVFHPIVIEFDATTGERIRRRLTVVATDGGGASEALPIGALASRSLALRINDSGLDVLEPILTAQVPLDVTDLIPVGVQIFDECFVDGGFLGCLAGARVRVANPPPSFDSFSVDADSQTNQLAATLVVNGLRAQFDIDGRGAVPNCGVRITATSATVNGFYDLRRDAGDPTQIDVVQVGNATVNAAGFNETFTSGLCDDPIIGDIIEAILPNITGEVEDGLADALNDVDGDGNTPVAAALEDALGAIDLTGPVGEAIGGTMLAEIHDVREDPAGFTDVQHTAFIGDACTPPPGAPIAFATYAEPAGVAFYGSLSPSGIPYGLAVGLSSAGLNQVLRSQVECGLLTTEVAELPNLGPLEGTFLSQLIPELAQFPLETVYELRIRPTVSPVVTTRPGPGGALAELLVAGLVIELRDVAGALPPLVDMVVDGRLGLDVSISEGELGFDLTPPMADDLSVSITLNEVGTDEEALSDTVEELFALLLPFLGDGLGGIPVPEFLGLQLTGVDADRVGDFFTLFADVAPAP